jgi:hypothetical protein
MVTVKYKLRRRRLRQQRSTRFDGIDGNVLALAMSVRADDADGADAIQMNATSSRGIAVVTMGSFFPASEHSPVPSAEADLRLPRQIVDDRHGRGSTIVTSQLPVDHWHEVIGNPPSPMPSSTASCTTPTGSR